MPYLIDCSGACIKNLATIVFQDKNNQYTLFLLQALYNLYEYCVSIGHQVQCIKWMIFMLREILYYPYALKIKALLIFFKGLQVIQQWIK